MEQSDNEIEKIYTVYCKDTSGITLLKKAFRLEYKAYEYAILKITTLLNIINEEYKLSPAKTLPTTAQSIFVLYNMKYDHREKYDYFKENHIRFFRYVMREPIMFYVSQLQLI